MSTGYTPLFSSLTTGTLCGRWPDIGLWPIVLSLADRHGVVDVTPDYLAKVTGLSLKDVIACMARFCAPDPYSRTPDEEGARLILLDANSRSWGWRVVNHTKYCEKARKAAFDATRVEDGRNAERMRARRIQVVFERYEVIPSSRPLRAEANRDEAKHTVIAERVFENAKAQKATALNEIAVLQVELANQQSIVTRCDEFFALYERFAEGAQ
ncbi:MAG: hypothetical protein JWO52_2557 [Gammaproteobacteria bacterium]|nr:hypothetical protein [Gammaproteobacteria bacterium]